jgi:hypothetical protein
MARSLGRSLQFFNRAQDFMLHQQPEQRESVRMHFCLSATAVFPAAPRLELQALVRDISSHGVMFYANFPGDNAPPPVGTEVSLSFFLPVDNRQVRVRWAGRVVRLVRYPAGAATGVALRLHSQELAEMN